jgi:hypothetical protein
MLNLPNEGARVYITEILINNKKIQYDICSSKTIDEAMEYYKDTETVHYRYIGSGNVYFVNGTRKESKDIMHCFVKCPKKRKDKSDD